MKQVPSTQHSPPLREPIPHCLMNCAKHLAIVLRGSLT